MRRGGDAVEHPKVFLDLRGIVTCDRVADLVAALPSAWVVSPT